MDEQASTTRTRDRERTRQALLDSAETLFAARGYEAASLEEIARAAGFSRGTPGYLFGSKLRLYEAVLERAFADELALVGGKLAEAAAAGRGSEAELFAVIEGLIDFADARPNVLRLIEREALGASPERAGQAGISRAMRDGLTVMADLLSRGRFRPVDPAHLVLDLLALCWFPAVHTETFVRGLGLNPDGASYKAERKRLVAEMVLRGIKTA